MARLTASPSQGKSEVLETLHYQGAIGSGVALFRLGPMVSHRWKGDENRQGSDPQFESDLLTVLAALQSAGHVVGSDDDGNAVDLSDSPDPAARVKLTGAGRVAARHPRPRPRTLRS